MLEKDRYVRNTREMKHISTIIQEFVRPEQTILAPSIVRSWGQTIARMLAARSSPPDHRPSRSRTNPARHRRRNSRLHHLLRLSPTEPTQTSPRTTSTALPVHTATSPSVCYRHHAGDLRLALWTASEGCLIFSILFKITRTQDLEASGLTNVWSQISISGNTTMMHVRSTVHCRVSMTPWRGLKHHQSFVVDLCRVIKSRRLTVVLSQAQSTARSGVIQVDCFV